MSAVERLARPPRIRVAHRWRWKCSTGHTVYANDNPYRFTDPDGRAPDTDFGLGAMAESIGGSPETTEKMAPITAVGVGVMLSASGLGEAAGLVKAAITVRQPGEKVVANLAKGAIKDDVKGAVRQIVKGGGEKQFNRDTASAMKGAEVKTVQTDKGAVQVGTHSDGSTVSARSFSSSDRPTIQVKQPDTSVTTKVRYDKDQ